MMVNTLDLLDRGTRGEILAITDAPGTPGTGNRLRRIGLREGIVVEVMSRHDPVLLRFDGCCIAVGRSMLRGVTICRCGCDKEDERSQRRAGRHRDRGHDA